MQNWAGNFAFTVARLHRPTSISQVQRVVAASPKIRAIGARHSFNGIADAPDMVDLGGIDPDIVIDRERMTVTVGAGVSYGDLSSLLHQQGVALHNLASLPQITVAGAIATATHGSGDGNRALSSAVVGLELVVNDGSLLRVERGDADFEGMVVSLGAFGIVSRVTLAIEPTFDIRQDAFVDMPWDELLAKFDAISSAAYSFSIFTKWSESTASRIWFKSRLAAAHAGEFDITGLGSNLGLKPGVPYSVPATVEDPLALLNPFGVPGPWSDRLTHTRREISPPPADQIQSEYLIARPQLNKAVAMIRAMAERVDALLFATEIRSIAADELWLSPAYRQATIGLHFTWKKQPDAVDAITKELEAALIPLGARPHWGKLIHADAATLAPLYPRMADFRSLALRHDPDGKFRNAYLEKHVFG